MRDSQFVEDLRARFNAGEKFKYVFFYGHRLGNGITAACFSQWYEAPFVVDGQRYPTAEHFMMAEKAALFGDLEMRAQVLQAPSPGVAKSLGSFSRPGLACWSKPVPSTGSGASAWLRTASE